MCTLQHQQRELELLNSNMDQISQELECLLLTNEQQYNGKGLEGAAALDCYNNPDKSFTQQEYWQCVQEQQQVQLRQQQQQQLEQEFLKQQQLLKENQQQLQQFNNMPYYFSNPKNQMSLNVEHSYVGAPVSAVMPYKVPPPNRHAASADYAASNKYEFHYLRPQSFNKSSPNTNPIPLISAATNFGHSNSDHRSGEPRRSYVGGGAYRKHIHHKYNNKKHDVTEQIDYDKIVINMEELGFTGEDMSEKNPVLRLFGKFRLLNYYLHDVFPFGPTIYGLPTQPLPIPYTMNVQYQVKNAARNSMFFMCNKERILNANKLLDRELYEECEKSLNVMKKLHAQLESFKRIEMEHKRCQFVTEEAKVQELRLESVLEQLSDQVRECNLLVHVFNWSMEMKHKTKTDNLAIANTNTLTQNNDDDDGRDGNNHYTPPETEYSGMRQPIRYIG